MTDWLEGCELKNGQINWFCHELVKSQDAKFLTDSTQSLDASIVLDKHQILEEIQKDSDLIELVLF